MDFDPLFVYFVHFGIYGSDLTYPMYEQIFTYIYIYICVCVCVCLVVSLFTNVSYVFAVYFMECV